MTDSTHSPSSAHILIVDDNATNRTLLSAILSREYRVKEVSSGAEALREALSSAPPDLILLDIMMPGMDGYEVCRRLQADPSTKNIPIIFVSAKTEPEEEAMGFELGAVDYVCKPINQRILRARVKTHLKLKAYADELERLLATRYSADP